MPPRRFINPKNRVPFLLSFDGIPDAVYLRNPASNLKPLESRIDLATRGLYTPQGQAILTDKTADYWFAKFGSADDKYVSVKARFATPGA